MDLIDRWTESLSTWLKITLFIALPALCGLLVAGYFFLIGAIHLAPALIIGASIVALFALHFCWKVAQRLRED